MNIFAAAMTCFALSISSSYPIPITRSTRRVPLVVQLMILLLETKFGHDVIQPFEIDSNGESKVMEITMVF